MDCSYGGSSFASFTLMILKLSFPQPGSTLRPHARPISSKVSLTTDIFIPYLTVSTPRRRTTRRPRHHPRTLILPTSIFSIPIPIPIPTTHDQTTATPRLHLPLRLQYILHQRPTTTTTTTTTNTTTTTSSRPLILILQTPAPAPPSIRTTAPSFLSFPTTRTRPTPIQTLQIRHALRSQPPLQRQRPINEQPQERPRS